MSSSSIDRINFTGPPGWAEDAPGTGGQNFQSTNRAEVTLCHGYQIRHNQGQER